MAISQRSVDSAERGRRLDPSRINVQRSLILTGIGALVGLALAGFALFTAKGTSTLAVPPEDVALVNEQPINRVDYIAQIQALYGVDLAHATEAQRHKVLDDMIREELFVQRGKELDVASTDPEVRSAMVNAVEQMAAADAISVQPGDAKLRAYFEAHPERYAEEGRMTVQDFVFPAAAADAAAQAAQALKSGGPAPEIVSRFGGVDSGKVNGEEFYFAAKIHLGDQLFAVARTLSDGGVSSPVVLPDGIHLLAMIRNMAPVPFDFDHARDQVLNDYRNEAVKRVTTDDEVFFRKRANILIAKDLR